MNDTTSTPSRLLKITAVTARWLLALLLAAWLLFALSVLVLHGAIVPRIDQYRGALQARASKAIGVPVSIGSIRAESAGLFPTFELHDVVLHDRAGRAALRLARVVASVSPRSLWRLSFEQLYVERLELEVRRDAAGKLHIAGLDMDQGAGTSGEHRGADWFFSQREFVLQGGTVRWIDEQRGAEPLLMTDVRFVARNAGRQHLMRLDATPPPGWGERFTLRGDLRQPLWSLRRGNFQHWSGQLQADLPHIDVKQLDRYVKLDARIRAGDGALRAWADVVDGRIVGGAADLALRQVNVLLQDALAPLALRSLTGRVAGRRDDGQIAFSTTELQFDTADGVRWPGGNLHFQHAEAKGRTPERGVLRADRLDLGVLALVANRLPLGDATHRALAAYAPRGLVERVDASWQGALAAPERYQAKGRISELTLAAQSAPMQSAQSTSATGSGSAARAHGATTRAVAPAASAANPVSNPAANSVANSAANPAAGATQAHAGARPTPGRPGLRGATLDFDASHSGGSGTLAISQGALDFPGVFEESLIPIDQLSAQLQWKLDGDKIALQIPSLRFANADATGQAQASWRTADAAAARGQSRFPGVLDLTGQLTQVKGPRVFRYLPLEIPKATRDYVQGAITQGSAPTVDFRVRGDLNDMPFADPRRGEFRIAARLVDVGYAYVPPDAGTSSSAAKPAAWPALTQLSGELVFERGGMQLRNARGRIAGAPALEVTRAEARIADLDHKSPLLQLDLQARGPLADVLRVGAPLLDGASASASAAAVRASGNADYRLKLDLPIDTPDHAKLQASVVLGGNDLQLAPGAPALQQARGTLALTEAGFTLSGVQARLAGGEVRIEGRGRYAGGQHELALSAQGSASAEGLRAMREPDWLGRLARQASGSAAYSASLSLAPGSAPEFSLTSNLQGMALQAPAPLVKTASESMPLRIDKKVVLRDGRRLHDELKFELGTLASAQYVRDVSADEPKVLRGSIAIGVPANETPIVPPRGVIASVRLARLDIDAWRALFGEAPGGTAQQQPQRPQQPLQPLQAQQSRQSQQAQQAQQSQPQQQQQQQQQPQPQPQPQPVLTAAPDAEGAAAYLPSQVSVRAQNLTLAGRALHDVVLGASRDGAAWRGHIDAQELSGAVEYRQSQGGRLQARLTRLKIAAAEATQVESLLDEPPEDLPALDIVVDDFELLGRRLGRAEIDAVNRGGAAREWRLNRLQFSNPDASFSAQGSWAAARRPGERRRTAMEFKLDIADAGALLNRLGMKDVLRRGRGTLAGEVEWRGSPFSLDYPSLAGKLHLEVGSGQFLKADPGIAKLLGVLSLQALPRRLTLDFRDVFSQGFGFDFIRGDATIDAGTARSNNLQMKGVNAAVLMSGSADFARETQDLNVVVVPELNAGGAALVATAINPALGLTAFLAQMVLKKPLIAATTQEFQVDGSWADPKVTKLPRRGAGASAPASQDASASASQNANANVSANTNVNASGTGTGTGSGGTSATSSTSTSATSATNPSDERPGAAAAREPRQ